VKEDELPLRLEWRSPAELAEHPANWRRHPESQIAALTDVIAEVGWAGACLFNERTGRMIDGHARRKVALEQGTERVPVLVGDWSEEQEKLILASLDPLAAMAETDEKALGDLLKEVEANGGDLQAMLDSMMPDDGELVEGFNMGKGGPAKNVVAMLAINVGDVTEFERLVAEAILPGETAAQCIMRCLDVKK
jgi:hypothetical protein